MSAWGSGVNEGQVANVREVPESLISSPEDEPPHLLRFHQVLSHSRPKVAPVAYLGGLEALADLCEKREILSVKTLLTQYS